MTQPAPTASRSRRTSGRWRALFAGALVLLVFGGVVTVVSLELRERLRAQVLQREGEVLQSVAAMQALVVAETSEQLGLPDIDEPLEVALDTSKLRGVVAVRLFDSSGGFLDSVPVEVEEGRIEASDLSDLARNLPVVRFHARFSLVDLVLEADESTVAPMLEVNVPFAASSSASESWTVFQYWMNGASVARELSRLDREIFVQAGAAFLGGALLIAGSLAWGFRRLHVANRLLYTRAEDLARANRELAQSARTSAIGAITAHLMHGLRNPVAGLEGFVASRSAESSEGGEAWIEARESTRRVRAMIEEVNDILRDVGDGLEFEVSARELCAGVIQRVQQRANARSVRLEAQVETDGALGAREAGIGGLVLANLVNNAIDASPAGGKVSLRASATPDAMTFQVADHGSGMPEEVRGDPFRPRRSTKPDGAGIGLAISHEMSRHAGGELTLERSDANGAVFGLRLPLARVMKGEDTA